MNLQIVKTSAAFRRPKREPVAQWPQWAVWNSSTRKREFGPASLARCQRFINDHPCKILHGKPRSPHAAQPEKETTE